MAAAVGIDGSGARKVKVRAAVACRRGGERRRLDSHSLPRSCSASQHRLAAAFLVRFAGGEDSNNRELPGGHGDGGNVQQQ